MDWKAFIAVQTLALALSYGPSAVAAPAPTASPSPVPKKSPREAKKTPVRRPDIEGTQAHDRFEAEISIPSHYKIDGKPLEVDPD